MGKRVRIEDGVIAGLDSGQQARLRAMLARIGILLACKTGTLRFDADGEAPDAEAEGVVEDDVSHALARAEAFLDFCGQYVVEEVKLDARAGVKGALLDRMWHMRRHIAAARAELAEQEPYCGHFVDRKCVVWGDTERERDEQRARAERAEAELAGRGEGTIMVGVREDPSCSTNVYLGQELLLLKRDAGRIGMSEPGIYPVGRRLPDASEPEVRVMGPWRFYRGESGSTRKLLVCHRCAWSGEFAMLEGPQGCPDCGVAFGPGRTVDETDRRIGSPLPPPEPDVEKVRPVAYPLRDRWAYWCSECNLYTISVSHSPACCEWCKEPWGDPRPLESAGGEEDEDAS